MSGTTPKNQAAYLKSKDDLARRFPKGHFIALDDGEIVADAESFDRLTEALAAIGKDRTDVLVVQAGIEVPDEVFILL